MFSSRSLLWLVNKRTTLVERVVLFALVRLAYLLLTVEVEEADQVCILFVAFASAWLGVLGIGLFSNTIGFLTLGFSVEYSGETPS